jgi:hypothetical protein
MSAPLGHKSLTLTPSIAEVMWWHTFRDLKCDPWVVSQFEVEAALRRHLAR